MDIKEHYHSIASLLVLEDSFTSFIEAENYAEVLRVIEGYAKGKIADKFIIFNKAGEIFAESGAPGIFGSKDSLSPLAVNVLKSTNNVDIFTLRKGKLNFYTFHSISTINGLIGSLFIGKDIQEFIQELNNKKDYYLKEIRIVQSNNLMNSWDTFSVKKLDTEQLPEGYNIKFKTDEWRNYILKTVISFILISLFYLVFVKFWTQYQVTSEKLRQEEITRASSARLVALGEMSAGLAHEINNPLTIIILKLNQIAKRLNDNNFDKEKLKDDIALLSNTSNRISKIIKSIKGVSRNAEDDPMEKVNLKLVSEDALELCRERFKNNLVDLMTNIEEINDVHILGKGTQITQVLLNLLGNGLDAVSILDEKWVKLTFEKKIDENVVIIRITDSGSGIPNEVLTKMQSAFFTTKEVGRGTGLGLHITRNIISEHKGEFFYDDKSKNTSFVIRLPLFKTV